MLKIDVFPHILPRPFYDRLMQVAPSSGLMVKRVQNIPVMIDIDKRFEVMDLHEGYVQVLTLSAPPLENVAGPDLSPELAKLANDEMANLVERYPDRFPGFVASLPMNNPDAAMREIDRAISQVGATGVQLFTNVNGEPLDKPEYLQIFDRMAEIDLPVWMHPARTANFPDYVGEKRSKYDLWWAFGWPYETGVAMGRLLFSGLFDRRPNLKVITHHLGGIGRTLKAASAEDWTSWASGPTIRRMRRRGRACRNDPSTTSVCSMAIRRCSGRRTRSNVDWRFSAASMCCSGRTCRSIPRVGPGSCATRSKRSTTSMCLTPTVRRFTRAMRSAC
jgi:aminocarboxymuconate-semialdehyde decarboxylase